MYFQCVGLRKNEILYGCIGLLIVKLTVLLHHLIGYVACTPRFITNRPEVTTQISLARNMEHLLKMVRGATFRLLHKHTHAY